MTDFSVSAAAFSGFRFIRQKPLTIVTWAVAFVVLFAVVIGIFALMAGGSMLAMMGSVGSIEQNPAAALAFLPGLVGAFLIAMILMLLASGVIYGAVYRAFLRPGEGGLGYFRVGRDELRLVGAYFLLMLIYMGVNIVGQIVVAALAFASNGKLAWIGVLALLGVIVWGAVRLSLVLPATFDQRRIAIGDSWALTKGHFWKLLGTYLLTGVILSAAYFAVALVFLALVFAAVGGASHLSDIGQAMALLPVLIAFFLLYPIIGACVLPIMVGPAIIAYQSLHSDAGATAETFA